MNCNNIPTNIKRRVLSDIISPDNIIQIGERVTLCSLRVVCQYETRGFSSLYKSLLRDIYRSADPANLYSDAYDIVQTVICFLCEHMGESMLSVYKTDSFGKPITLQNEAFHIAWRCFEEMRQHLSNTVKIDRCSETDLSVEMKTFAKEKDFAKGDKIIRKMHLTEGEKDVLDCYLCGMGHSETARQLSISRTTVWRRRNKLREKYLALKRNLTNSVM